MKGKIIVIKGLDGSGKETQTKLLEKALLEEGLSVQGRSFPCYGTPACIPVEMYLSGKFGGNPNDVNPYAASIMYAADHFASFKTDWEPFYSNGGIIIADRYVTSNAIFQGSKISMAERGDYLNWLYNLEYKKMAIPAPDLVFYLGVHPKLSVQLLSARTGKAGVQRDIHEMNLTYLNQCSEAALDIAKQNNWVIIQTEDEAGGLRSREAVHQDILSIVHRLLHLNLCTDAAIS